MVKQDYFHHRVLMCPPKYFDIEFVINPYMNLKNKVNKKKSWKTWRNLYSIIKSFGIKIDLLKPVKGIPDFVFPADAGFIVFSKRIKKPTIVLANFKYPERQKETPHYEKYFKSKGYKTVKLPKHIRFEMNIQQTDKFYLMAYGQRNDKEGAEFMKKYLDKTTYVFKLKNPWFYHLGSVLTVLNNDTVLYYPYVFGRKDRLLIKQLFKNRIAITKSEALRFGANCVIINDRVITSYCTDRLKRLYKKHNIKVIVVSTKEFEKAGGAVGCMVFPSKRIKT